ncbi:TPA: hypothetical protein ACGO5I_001443 [Streptococcus suis]
MKAGYLVGTWISNQLKTRGYHAAINYLAPKIGAGLAGLFVGLVVKFGVSGAAGSIAAYLGTGSSLAGPLGTIIGYASGFA